MSQDELKKALQTARFAHERETELTYTITGFGALLRAVEILVERQDNPSEADSGIVAKLEQKIKMQHARIAELEKRIAEQDAEHEKIIDDKRRAEARVRAWEARTGEAGPSAPRIVGAKLEPMTVDGKTPGQVFGEAFRNGFGKRVVPHLDSELVRTHGGELVRDYQREQELDWANAMEIGAIAVLRAFGQPSQTTTGAVEALRRVRHAMFPNPRGQTTDPEARHRMQIIDDELAKLKAKPAPASDHAHELGSCSFCDKQPANPSPVQYANEVARYGTEVCARAGLVRNDSGSPPDTSTESGLPDAQTPGQVGLAAWNAKFVEQHGGDIVAWENESMEAREREEASARAVLDVYGKRMVREALRKGLHRIQGMGAQPSEETFKADVIAALNEEIAELASVPSRPDVVLREMS